jgi:outer membrane receptor protein involved in Fe transport
MNPTRWLAAAAVATAALGAARTARAQSDNAPAVDIEVPTVVLDTTAGKTVTDDSALDLANVVQSAAKGVTTVQEAPVIVTVLTSDEIADRQYQTVEDAINNVPGWMAAGLVNEQFPTALVRGQIQAVQLLQDGTSLFDPFVNVATLSKAQPLETIKRIEMITGPGGVLWGSNSLVGIMNIITKDADDIDGVEVGGGLGGGNGDRNMARAYFMYGDPDLAHGKAKLFLHGSFDTYDGPGYEMPSHEFSSPLPQPNAPIFEGPITQADPPRSYLIDLDGKLTLGKFELRAQLPFQQRQLPMGFPGNVVRQSMGEDNLPQCAPTSDPTMWIDPTNTCIDRGRQSRANEEDYFDRFLVGEYRSRLAHGKAGISLKAYGMQFVRNFAHLQVLEPVPTLLQGGLAFSANPTSYRYGTALDGDVELARSLRVLYGAEAFHELSAQDVTESRQGAGTQTIFFAPYDLTKLPTPCPLTVDPTTHQPTLIAGCPLTFAFPAARTVLGAYVDPQWRPSKKLILDAGIRVQASPKSLGLQGYDPNITGSGTAVFAFADGYHLKLNFAQGFRPPVFNDIVSNGNAVELGGSPNLKVETSQAEQAEINGRIFKGERRIRELSFRADYSYTTINNFIQLVAGRYQNSADRGISSAEFLGKLYLQGGHRIELGYTWLRVETADIGTFKSMPENWFNLGAVWNLVDGKLTATTTMSVVGAQEDPNRMVEYRNYGYDQYGHIVDLNTMQVSNIVVTPSMNVMDKLPAQYDLMVGLTWTPTKKLRIRATAFNALNGRYYTPDAFGDYQPRLEFQPMPTLDFRAYLNASYSY